MGRTRQAELTEKEEKMGRAALAGQTDKRDEMIINAVHGGLKVCRKSVRRNDAQQHYKCRAQKNNKLVILVMAGFLFFPRVNLISYYDGAEVVFVFQHFGE